MKSLKLLASSAAFATGMCLTAQAQVMIDMSKFTCEQLLKGTGDSIEAAIWFSGYYNGVRKNTKLDLNQYRKNGEAIVAECKNSPNTAVMQTIKKMMSRKK